jgi:hypothetical protein
MKRLFILMLMSFGLTLAIGCGAQPGKTVVKYEKGKTTRMTEAPRDGTYSLYSSTDATAKVSHALSKGDKIGFTEKDGKIYAVAGDHEEPIEAGMMARNFYWKMQKE